jgi:hypothetical protein
LHLVWRVGSLVGTDNKKPEITLDCTYDFTVGQFASNSGNSQRRTVRNHCSLVDQTFVTGISRRIDNVCALGEVDPKEIGVGMREKGRRRGGRSNVVKNVVVGRHEAALDVAQPLTYKRVVVR